jgi:glycosyltransferase involved in cell wall biosynthesis
VGVLFAAIASSALNERWRIEVFDLSKPQQEGKPSVVTVWDVLHSLWHLVALPARIRRVRPAVVLYEATADTGWFRDLALIAVCRLCGVPVVIHWHGAPDSWQFPGRTRWRQWLFRLGARRAATFIALTEPFGDYFARFLDPARITVIPNFTDRTAFAAPPRPARDGLALLAVGRVGPLKGFDVLCEAIARTRAEIPGLTAVCVGAGETEAAWRAACAHPLVQDGTVRLAGQLDAERAAEYRRADVFVLPSRTEIFPVSIVEAMAAGLPVVASDVGGVRWILADGGCGIVVPPGDAAALAAALLRLARDADARVALAERGRRRQQERFDITVVVAALDGVLARAAGLSRPASPGTPASTARGS